MLSWAPEGNAGAVRDIKAEVRANAVWRRGRLFLICPRFERRATRLYIPAPPWTSAAGVVGDSATVVSLRVISRWGFWGACSGLSRRDTSEKRKRRRTAAVGRSEQRRPFL